ncbi:hypothetical protein [Eisenbergiella tayi]|nr:hypothetical protein [Eisenbergiella tayi]MDT4534323.1 hypothetical protein [Eisenbergiella tayi]
MATVSTELQKTDGIEINQRVKKTDRIIGRSRSSQEMLHFPG